jgi:hypothetical protein
LAGCDPSTGTYDTRIRASHIERSVGTTTLARTKPGRFGRSAFGEEDHILLARRT